MSTSRQEVYPIAIHYYDGKMGITAFGHIGIQVGNAYYSYGLDKENNLCSASYGKFMQTRLNNEESFYGQRSMLVLPEEWYLPPDEVKAKQTEFQKKWSPAEYNLGAKNCAHCGADAMLFFLDQKKIPAEALDKIKKLATGYFTKPTEVNKAVAKLSRYAAESRDKALRETLDLKRSDSNDEKLELPSIKFTIEKMIDNLIDRINAEIFKRKSKWFSKSKILEAQQAIFLLMQLRNKIKNLTILQLKTELEKILAEHPKLDNKVKESLDYFQELIQERMNHLEKEEFIKKEELDYQEKYTQRKKSTDALAHAYELHQAALSLLEIPGLSEKYFKFKDSLNKYITHSLNTALKEIHEDKEPNFELIHTLTQLISECFLEFDLGKLSSFVLIDQLKPFTPSSDAIQKLKDLAFQFSRMTPDLLVAKEINTFKNDIKQQITLIETSQESGKHKRTFSRSQEEKKAAEETAKASTAIFTQLHIDWVNLQLKKINHWYTSDPDKSKNILRSNELIISSEIQQRILKDKFPDEQLKALLEKVVRPVWHQSADRYKKVVSDQLTDLGNREATDMATVAYLNQASKKDHTYTRDVGYLIFQMESMLHIHDSILGDLQLTYLEDPADLDSELMHESKALKQFSLLQTTEIPLLPDTLSSKAHLMDVAKSLAMLAKGSMITYYEALKELLEEINRAIQFENHSNSPNKAKHIELLKRCKEELRSLSSEEKVSSESKDSFLVTVRSAIREFKKQESIPASTHDKLHGIYSKLQYLADAKQHPKLLTEIQQEAKQLLSDPQAQKIIKKLKEIQNVSGIKNPNSVWTLLLGIAGYKPSEPLPKAKSALEQLLQAGLAQLPQHEKLFQAQTERKESAIASHKKTSAKISEVMKKMDEWHVRLLKSLTQAASSSPAATKLKDEIGVFKKRIDKEKKVDINVEYDKFKIIFRSLLKDNSADSKQQDQIKDLLNQFNPASEDHSFYFAFHAIVKFIELHDTDLKKSSGVFGKKFSDTMESIIDAVNFKKSNLHTPKQIITHLKQEIKSKSAKLKEKNDVNLLTLKLADPQEREDYRFMAILYHAIADGKFNYTELNKNLSQLGKDIEKNKENKKEDKKEEPKDREGDAAHAHPS